MAAAARGPVRTTQSRRVACLAPQPNSRTGIKMANGARLGHLAFGHLAQAPCRSFETELPVPLNLAEREKHADYGLPVRKVADFPGTNGGRKTGEAEAAAGRTEAQGTAVAGGPGTPKIKGTVLGLVRMIPEYELGRRVSSASWFCLQPRAPFLSLPYGASVCQKQ